MMNQGQAIMDAIEAIKTRRCIRAYTEQSVAREIIEDVIDCGRLAATARNEQPWEFVVLTDPNQLRSIAQKADYGRFIAKAPVCILVLCKDTKYYLEDGSAATQNILVAAKAHGLGACWVAGDKKEYADEVCREIGATKGYKLVSMTRIAGAADSGNLLCLHGRLDGLCDCWQAGAIRQVECVDPVALLKTSEVRLPRGSVGEHGFGNFLFDGTIVRSSR